MPVEEDVKAQPHQGGASDDADRSDSRTADESRPHEASDADLAAKAADGKVENDGPSEEPAAPTMGAISPSQMGTIRFVYAGYFGGAMAVGFFFSKIADFAWERLQAVKPAIGDPRDEVIMPLSVIVGVGTALYFWYRTRTRELAEEVASEMAKVTWPTRTEVTNGTVVVIVTTIVSTVFFALMDKFWGFITNLVYGGS
jgi:preprotein translocase subunit SecE